MSDFCIWNTYVKENATLSDIPSLISEFANLKKDYQEFIKNDIKTNKSKEAKSLLVFNGIHGLVDKIIKDSKSYEKGHYYDYSLNLSIYFNQNKIVVQAFGEKNSLLWLKDNLHYPSYDYIDYVESDEDIPDNWDERGEFWHNIFKTTGIPANVSLSYDLYDEENLSLICWDLFEELVEGKKK